MIVTLLGSDIGLSEETRSVNNFHILKQKQTGWYRVRAKNYIGEYGQYSIPSYFNEKED